MDQEIIDTLANATAEKDKKELYKFLIERVNHISKNKSSREEVLFSVCSMLRDFVPAFDWVGFYLVDPKKIDELILGPFVGKPTEHLRIPFGEGICGRSAATKEPFIVGNVAEETNYLSCDPDVRSEIVVPVMKDKQLVALLDVDSLLKNPFDDTDREFLENVADVLAGFF